MVFVIERFHCIFTDYFLSRVGGGQQTNERQKRRTMPKVGFESPVSVQTIYFKVLLCQNKHREGWVRVYKQASGKNLKVSNKSHASTLELQVEANRRVILSTSDVKQRGVVTLFYLFFIIFFSPVRHQIYIYNCFC